MVTQSFFKFVIYEKSIKSYIIMVEVYYETNQRFNVVWEKIYCISTS